MINFGQIFYILTTSAARELKQWRQKTKIFQLRLYLWGFSQERSRFSISSAANYEAEHSNISTYVCGAVEECCWIFRLER